MSLLRIPPFRASSNLTEWKSRVDQNHENHITLLLRQISNSVPKIKIVYTRYMQKVNWLEIQIIKISRNYNNYKKCSLKNDRQCNKKNPNLCLRQYTLKTYCFVAEITFNVNKIFQTSKKQVKLQIYEEKKEIMCQNSLLHKLSSTPLYYNSSKTFKTY